MKRITQLMATATLVCAAMLPCVAQETNGKSNPYDGLPFEMQAVTEPQIPDYTISITDFGGKADGTTLNTESFKKAVAHLAEHGGGRLVVPRGVWYTGPIELKSHIELHVEEGALVLFSGDRADYPLVDSYFEGTRSRRCMSPLSAFNAEHIAITGKGVFNGNGQHWRPVKKGKMTEGQWKELCRSGVVNDKGDIWYPNEQIRKANEDPQNHIGHALHDDTDEAWQAIHDYLRPTLLSFINCKNVLLEDATFENSPAWNIHPMMCENITLRNVYIRNPWYSQNGDGLDLESCKNAIVTGCSFDVGDDAICIKSGRDEEGRRRAMPTENVIIRDCRVYHGHGGFVIGSEMSGGVRNIFVDNCLFIGTDTGLRFKSTRGRGGIVEDIFISNIGMTDIPGDAITFDLYYGGKSPSDTTDNAIADETTPSFRNITISDITCRGAKRAIYMNGLPEMPIQGVSVLNSTMTAHTGVELSYIDGLTLDNVKIECETGEAINEKTGVKDLTIKKTWQNHEGATVNYTKRTQRTNREP